MVNRKEEQGSEAISSIKKEKADADVEWKHCDMGSLKEVKEVFSGLRNSLERLDFLVESAVIGFEQCEDLPRIVVVHGARLADAGGGVTTAALPVLTAARRGPAMGGVIGTRHGPRFVF